MAALEAQGGRLMNIQLSEEDTTISNTSNELNALDCISRQEAIRALCLHKIIDHSVVRRVLTSLPSAQPVRKTGQWIKRKKGAIGYNCSCCGKSDISNHFDYCPNCGADMRSGEDE